MAVIGARVSVGTSATELSAATQTDYSSSQSVLVKNLDATASIDLGGSGVTTGNGFQLAAGESVSIDLGDEHLYGITASGTVSVAVLRQGV